MLDHGTSESAPAAAACRVLVADDNRVVRALLRAQLEDEGYDVVGEASDGEEAIRLVGELRPQVLVLDLSMPRMDGLQALPLILAASPDVRVIVLSGFGQDQMQEQVLAAGAARYVEKSLKMDLPGLIASVLAGS